MTTSPATSSDDPVGDVELRDLRSAVGDEARPLPRGTGARSSCATSRVNLPPAGPAQLAGGDSQEPADQRPAQIAGEADAARSRCPPRSG